MLRKDYRDLKIFQNAKDIESARSKLIIFVKKLIDDTNKLIEQISLDFEKSRTLAKSKTSKSAESISENQLLEQRPN